MHKRILAAMLSIVILLTLCLGFTSCGNEGYTVGICQFAPHEALDLATKGFKDALCDALGEDNVRFIEENAAGDANICSSIINTFVARDVDLILSNATSALEMAYNGTIKIPVLGTSITDYASVLGIKDFTGVTGENVSGTSDLAPIDDQIDMLAELFPNVKKVGLLYCSAEPNSEYQIREAEKALDSKNIEYKRFAFADANEVSSITTLCVAECDVIYIPTDNTAASCAQTIQDIVVTAKVPVVAGEENLCRGCGVVTLTIDYYELGRKTGEMAAKILKDGADIATMPIEYCDDPIKKYNESLCRELGITVPTDFVKIDE